LIRDILARRAGGADESAPLRDGYGIPRRNVLAAVADARRAGGDNCPPAGTPLGVDAGIAPENLAGRVGQALPSVLGGDVGPPLSGFGVLGLAPVGGECGGVLGALAAVSGDGGGVGPLPPMELDVYGGVGWPVAVAVE